MTTAFTSSTTPLVPFADIGGGLQLLPLGPDLHLRHPSLAGRPSPPRVVSTGDLLNRAHRLLFDLDLGSGILRISRLPRFSVDIHRLRFNNRILRHDGGVGAVVIRAVVGEDGDDVGSLAAAAEHVEETAEPPTACAAGGVAPEPLNRADLVEDTDSILDGDRVNVEAPHVALDSLLNRISEHLGAALAAAVALPETSGQLVA